MTQVSNTTTIHRRKNGDKGDDAVIYNLVPSHDVIKKDKNGNITPTTLNVAVSKTVGTSTTSQTVSSSTTGLYMYYNIDNATTWTRCYTSSNIALSSVTKNIRIRLQSTASTIENPLTGTVYQKKTIALVCDGDPGDPGNGINTVTLYRMTTMNFSAPEASDTGWVVSTSASCPTETNLSTTARYLWQKKVTTYTKVAIPTTEISLVAQFQDGVHSNLLDQTNFQGEGYMDKWYIANGEIFENIIGNHNGYCMSPLRTEAYREMLRQTVYHKNSKVLKLKPSTWYTLSFYGAMTNEDELLSTVTYNGEDGTAYNRAEKAHQEIYISAGQTIRLKVNGRMYNSNKAYMRVFLYYISDSSTGAWGPGSIAHTIKSSSDTLLDFTFTNNTGAGHLFRLEAYVYLCDSSGNIPSNETLNSSSSIYYRAYINYIKIDRGAKLATYLYRSDGDRAVMSATDTVTPWYVDGVKVTEAQTLPDGDTSGEYPLHNGTHVSFGGDGGIFWQMALGTRRHSFTFRTPDTLSTSTYYYLLFRMGEQSNWGWISMPKLEENTIATDYCSSEEDKTGVEGCVVRRSEWEAGKQYHNDSALSPTQCQSLYGTSTRYIDEVCVTNLSTGVATWKLCRVTHTSLAADGTEDADAKKYKWTNTTAWEAMNNISPFRTSFADIAQAFIQYLQVNQITLMDGNNVYGAFGKNSSGYPLWFGGTTAANAVTKFGADGSASLAKGNLTFTKDGGVTGKDCTFTGGTFSGKTSTTKVVLDATNCGLEIHSAGYNDDTRQPIANSYEKSFYFTQSIDPDSLRGYTIMHFGSASCTEHATLSEEYFCIGSRNSSGEVSMSLPYTKIGSNSIALHDSEGTVTVNADYFRTLNAFVVAVSHALGWS